MNLIQEKYSDSKITQLYELLVSEAEKHSPKDFDIRVDKLKVVSRTNNTERFYLHEKFIDDKTKQIVINLYDGASRRCTKLQFYFTPIPPALQPTPEDAEIILKERIEEYDRKYEVEKMLANNKNLQQQLEDAEEYIDELEKRLASEKKNKLNIADNIGSIAGIALEGILKRNVDTILGKQKTSLDGILKTKKTATPSVIETLNEVEKEVLEYIKLLQAKLNDETMDKVIDIIDEFYHHPDTIEIVYELLELEEDEELDKTISVAKSN